MAIPATQMRPGMIIKHNNELHAVFAVEHRTPATSAPLSRPSCAISAPAQCSSTASAPPTPSSASSSTKPPMEFLYADGDDYYFMNPVDYEQTTLKSSTLGDAVEYLTPNLQIKVSYFDGVPVGIELPAHRRNDRRRNRTRHQVRNSLLGHQTSQLETGFVVQVPPFINEGEKIRVDTAEGAYLSRA